jgi:hypothetical protein
MYELFAARRDYVVIFPKDCGCLVGVNTCLQGATVFTVGSPCLKICLQ